MPMIFSRHPNPFRLLVSLCTCLLRVLLVYRMKPVAWHLFSYLYNVWIYNDTRRIGMKHSTETRDVAVGFRLRLKADVMTVDM